MPSNLPPGVTDRMVDAQFATSDIDAVEAFEWYLSTDNLEDLGVWVTEVVADIIDKNKRRPEWVTSVLREFLADNEDHIVEQYFDYLAQGERDD